METFTDFCLPLAPYYLGKAALWDMCPRRAWAGCGPVLRTSHLGSHRALSSWCSICLQAVVGAGRQRGLSEDPTCASHWDTKKTEAWFLAVGLGGVSDVSGGTWQRTHRHQQAARAAVNVAEAPKG